jgi:tetratricopeptide (TPR) repeat protein
VQGHLDQALQIHTRALDIARRLGSPDWEVAQTIRIGNVRSLAGEADAVESLTAAVRLSRDIGSYTLNAFALNGLGVALDLMGDRAAALERHRQAWEFYEQSDSVSGMAYTGARIALIAGDGDTRDRAWTALRDATVTNDPRAIAHSLEALAMAEPEPTPAVRALAAAHGLRQSVHAPLPPLQARRLQQRRDALAAMLDRRFERLWHDAYRHPRQIVEELRSSAPSYVSGPGAARKSDGDLS